MIRFNIQSVSYNGYEARIITTDNRTILVKGVKYTNVYNLIDTYTADLYKKRDGIYIIKKSQLYKELPFNDNETNAIDSRKLISVVKEISHGINPKIQFQDKAIKALQKGCENHIQKMFERSRLIAIHSERVTVMPKDIHLSMALEDEYDRFKK